MGKEKMGANRHDAGSEMVKYTLYPEAGHDSWTKTYNNPEVWDWLLKQKRGGK